MNAFRNKHVDASGGPSGPGFHFGASPRYPSHREGGHVSGCCVYRHTWLEITTVGARSCCEPSLDIREAPFLVQHLTTVWGLTHTVAALFRGKDSQYWWRDLSTICTMSASRVVFPSAFGTLDQSSGLREVVESSSKHACRLTSQRPPRTNREDTQPTPQVHATDGQDWR